METISSYKNIIKNAKEAESEGDLEQAANLYGEAIKIEPSNEFAYERLMIIYRKQKQYKQELAIINSAIDFFENHHENKSIDLFSSNKKIVQLSNALMKKVGLKDKKGKSLYYPEPVARWHKRKQTVEKKLKSK